MKIVISRSDGGVSIAEIPYPMQLGTVLGKWRKSWPDDMYVSYRIITEHDVPADKVFRDAWYDSGNSIAVNMKKAREMHRASLRVMRRPLLEALDVEYMLADEAGDSIKKSEIAAQKQVLRDVTKEPAIDAANTPAELKQAIPAVLGSVLP